MSPPMLGEPLPIELANATYAVRGQLQDGLATVPELAQWLDRVRLRLPIALPQKLASTASDLRMARDLRDTIRSLATAATRHEQPDPAAVKALNKLVRAAPLRRELSWNESPSVIPRSDHPAVRTALSGIAQEAVDLFTGPMLADLRACHAPGCVLFFVKNHHRREWCSTACGNRARAARHYHQVRK